MLQGMKPFARASLALFAASVSFVICVACITCVNQLTHPLTMIALAFNVQDESRFCSFELALSAKTLVTMLVFLPAALLFAVPFVSLCSRGTRAAELLWLWSTLFAAIQFVPVVGWLFVAGFSESRVLARFITPENILAFAALTAPIWSYGLARSDEPAKKTPLRFSNWERAAAALLITSSVFAAAFVLKRHEMTREPPPSELPPNWRPGDY